MFPAPIRTALELKTAIETAPKRLKPIGTCVTELQTWMDCYDFGDEDERLDVPAAIEELTQLYENDAQCHSGYLPNSFKLTITHPGIKFSADIEPFGKPKDKIDNPAHDVPKSRTKDELVAMRQESEKRLKAWFKKADVSGYGDVRSQSTKVDAKVRNAREIPASHFTVSDNLCDDIERIWNEHFLPSSVRVEPYKIHLYGPGGKFKSHKDTPEKDLVGTFLVGLGDSTSDDLLGNLFVGHEIYGSRAYPGSYVAFYPDVPHKVTEIKEGYRAVIAFKLFRKDPTQNSTSTGALQPKTTFEQSLFNKTKSTLRKLPAPYGILLTHDYCLQTAELSGLDNVLHAAAVSVASEGESESTSQEVHFLPVLVHLDAEADWLDEEQREIDHATAWVYPLTEVHVDALLASSESDEDEDEDEDASEVNLSKTPYSWLRLCKNVPFYGIPEVGYCWSEEHQEGAEFTGNESRPDSEDSIYLSYAMVVVSSKKRKHSKKS
ncbi:unnamed protein product [Somion occarium]|uniref:Fe2OG dioxygenase domain-containing protein n=1 Tax=Somion occarium TaxID=3059160 RepID=A0ABP1E199_9APHY